MSPGNLRVEINGVAGEVASGPAPVAVVDDEAGIDGQNEIACLPFDELESALLGHRSVGDRSQVHEAKRCQSPPLEKMCRPAN